MEPSLFALAICAVASLVLNWSLEQFSHDRRLRAKRLRIHVNGIRGKSTVTRIVAGMLRESQIQTVAKTTGSAACLIDQQGQDHSIRRIGSPTILEQVGIVRDLDPDVEALVIECMAIKPEYQRICEEKIIQSNIGIITNVREDHQDVLGTSLPEIAQNLLLTCPTNGVLITSEQNPKLLPIFQHVTNRKNTKLIVADPNCVTDEQVNAFPYIAFKENISIGFALADLLGIDRATALKGMAEAAPDPGVLRIERARHQNTNIVWADLFAVNDRESVITCVERVSKLAVSGTVKIGLLNNRFDREHRAIQFAQIVANDIKLDFVALLGAYQRHVEMELLKHGYGANQIIRVDSHHRVTGTALVKHLVEHLSCQNVMMFGLVNIHTPQAESIREWFESRSQSLCTRSST